MPIMVLGEPTKLRWVPSVEHQASPYMPFGGGLAHRSRIRLPSIYESVLQRTRPSIVSQTEYSTECVNLGKHAKMILCYVIKSPRIWTIRKG